MDLFAASLGNPWSAESLMGAAIGAAIGIAIAGDRRINTVLALAIALPLTSAFNPLAAIALMIGLAKAGNIASVAMTKDPNGEPVLSLPALTTALFGGAIGHTCLIAIALVVGAWARHASPVEQCAVVVFTLLTTSSLYGYRLRWGLLATFMGVNLGFVGHTPLFSEMPFAVGIPYLRGPLPAVPVALGLIALPELMAGLWPRIREVSGGARHEFAVEAAGPPLADRASDSVSPLRLLSATLVGLGMGAVPWLHSASRRDLASLPAVSGATEAERLALRSARIRAAGAAEVSGRLIPLVSLGVPASMTAALVCAALLAQGFDPQALLFGGPSGIVLSPLLAGILAIVVLTVMSRVSARSFGLSWEIPDRTLYGSALVALVIGVVLTAGPRALVDLSVLILFGGLGWLMRLARYPIVCFLIGFVLSDTFQSTLYWSLYSLRGQGLSGLFDYPIAVTLAVLTPVVVWLLVCLNRAERRATAAAAAAP